ncbi:hypothetical protein AKJ08_1721 [Vulgatibacter incomptus]|uniref:Uncharacterized protein n=1 Tax=Vulgatibacter incomptus TaxID=1391653 RepID=A0A0K1PDY3_9BACT|nr:hypothetical protein AKJ08_1721 [Vulgatibacter incomptus]
MTGPTLEQKPPGRPWRDAPERRVTRASASGTTMRPRATTLCSVRHAGARVRDVPSGLHLGGASYRTFDRALGGPRNRGRLGIARLVTGIHAKL